MRLGPICVCLETLIKTQAVDTNVLSFASNLALALETYWRRQMRIRIIPFAILGYLVATNTSLFAQERVDPRNMYERVRAVVPLVGKGTPDDPKRPMYTPESSPDPTSRAGIIGFIWQTSDDGKFALIEFVAADRAAFNDILTDTTIKAFLKGKDKREDVEAEFKKHKKDFDFEHFGVVVVP